MLKFGAVVAAAMIASCGWAQSPADEVAASAKLAAREAETREFLMAHAKPIAAADAAYNASEFEPLLPMVKGKRLILVSEPTHGTHETRLENAKIVRFLVERAGVRTLIPELGYAEGLELDALVRRGVGDTDTIVKNDMGILWNTTEQAGMMRWIAGWNKAHPNDMVRIAGMDEESGTMAGPALAKLVAGMKLDGTLVARVKSGAEAADAMKGPAKATASDAEKKASADYDAALVDLIAAIKTLPQEPAKDDAWRSAMSVRSGRRTAEMRMEGNDGSDAGSRLREFEMARAALSFIAESSAPSVIVTHTVHLRAGRLTPQDKVQSVGYHLARALGDRAFFLGEEYGVGSMRAFVPTTGSEPAGMPRRLHAAIFDPPAPGSIAGTLGNAGPLLIDLRDPRDGSPWSDWLESMQATHLYPAITYDSGDATKPNWTVPADAFDALIYIPSVSPLRPIGEAQYVP
ncbi:MAG: Succinoglycan biosynthesis protein [Acidobacteriaceae bacterium]|nr:Succinoglycan biosynthesis protein [Acidobacteriaceae bacterium]